MVSSDACAIVVRYPQCGRARQARCHSPSVNGRRTPVKAIRTAASPACRSASRAHRRTGCMPSPESPANRTITRSRSSYCGHIELAYPSSRRTRTSSSWWRTAPSARSWPRSSARPPWPPEQTAKTPAAAPRRLPTRAGRQCLPPIRARARSAPFTPASRSSLAVGEHEKQVGRRRRTEPLVPGSAHTRSRGRGS
jgi:hypothetical protein